MPKKISIEMLFFGPLITVNRKINISIKNGKKFRTKWHKSDIVCIVFPKPISSASIPFSFLS